ncbi:MAG: DNA primase [Pseudomonadota bacterium]
MAFPPNFLDELRARVTLSDVVGRKVVWDRRKTNVAKGDWWAPCPFHQEKTASFHADDRKGFYYCFGCQAKGDAITFVKETENLSFVEAVERLAEEVGLEVPDRRENPAEAARRDRLSVLAEVMEVAVGAYRLALRSAAGQGARDYTIRRRLSDETMARFEIGYAPGQRHHLTERFREQGQLDAAVEAGLVIRPDDGGPPFDRFRDRLMFPIRDPRGRCIAFGGRALGSEAKAKYLNSPETPLFHKGRTLFHHGPAREAAGKAGTVVVAEGYMDVIALAQAGVGHALAPLGTAITEEQLTMLWKIAPEPIVALDGDKAGLRAAHKLIDLALQHLGAGRSLRFCLLPEGQDPDDLIRAQGPGAMQALLAEPLPLIEVLWRREAEAHALDTPERRGALTQRLAKAAAAIPDTVVRRFYEDGLRTRARELFWQLDRPKRASGGQRGRQSVPAGASETARRSSLALGNDASIDAARERREATILLIALTHPHAAAELYAALEAMPVTHGPFEPIRDALIGGAGASLPGRDWLEAELGPSALATLEADPVARAHPLANPGADADRVALVLGEAIARHTALTGHEDELAEARASFADADGEDWTWRLRQAGQARHLLDAGALRAEDDAEAAERPSPIADMIERHARTTPATKKPRPPSSNQ